MYLWLLILKTLQQKISLTILILNQQENFAHKCFERWQLDSIIDIDELRIPSGNMIEKLLGDKINSYSIRINQQYRLCFEWKDSSAHHVEIIDYH